MLVNFLFFNIISIPAPSSSWSKDFFFNDYYCCLFLDFIQGQNCSFWHKGETSRFILPKHKHSSDTKHGSFSPSPGLLHRHRRADSRVSVWLSLVEYRRKVWQPTPGEPQIISHNQIFFWVEETVNVTTCEGLSHTNDLFFSFSNDLLGSSVSKSGCVFSRPTCISWYGNWVKFLGGSISSRQCYIWSPKESQEASGKS